MSTTIQTKYGTASIDAQGYYVIHSKENKGKKLHRLIFEDFYNISKTQRKSFSKRIGLDND